MQLENGVLDCALSMPSPNFDERPVDVTIDAIIVHAISLPEGEFATPYIDDLFTNCLLTGAHPSFVELTGMRVASHLLIDRQGAMTQYVNFNKRAWHAGVSALAGREDCNNFSIGIELEGAMHIAYEAIQYQRLAEICHLLMQHYSAITAERIVGHSDVAPGRKLDPGPLFDWDYFRDLLVKNTHKEEQRHDIY